MWAAAGLHSGKPRSTLRDAKLDTRLAFQPEIMLTSRIENHQMTNRYAQARFGALVGILSNGLLFAVKLYAGLVAGSLALVYDAIHSLSDVVTSSFVLFGLWVAERPADSDHPYGHTKAESIAGSNLALLLILSSIWMMYEAIGRIGGETRVPGGLALAAAGFSIAVKESLFQWKVRLGRRVGSAAIVADAWHHRSDALSSAAVLAGLTAVWVLGPGYAWLDAAAAGLVGITLFATGLVLYRESLSDLMDAQVEGPVTDEIRERAQSVDGVYDIEQVRVRKAGMEYSVDIHVEVDASISTEVSHDIASRVRDTLTSEMAPVRQVLVHIEPHTLGHEPGGPHHGNVEE